MLRNLTTFNKSLINQQAMLKRFLLLLIAVISIFTSSLRAQSSFSQASQYKINTALDIISSRYVDKLSDDRLITDAILGILKDLDPHSVYIPAKDLKDVNEPLRGDFEGIGIQFNILNDTIMVISPISGGPSEKVGIQAGDKIVYADEELVAGVGITNEGVIKRLRGDKGTEVKIKVKRQDVKDLLEFTITRDKIPIFSMDASYMATPEIGYIKLNRFAATTVNEFKKALKDLQNDGMHSLILDIRGNGGGYLNEAIDLADEFLSTDKLIVYTEGKSSTRREALSTNKGGFEHGKLVVLTDEGSASASEIVSGALQDWDRAVIIGRRTFGKGLVQRDFSLPDQSVIRLTIARYYTPTGRSIQKPYDKGIEAYQKEIIDRFESGEVIHPDSISFPDSLKYYTPNNRVVYGGGGIMPDIYVPLDTQYNSTYYTRLLQKGILIEFALQYVEDHRKELKIRYTTVEDFINNFDEEVAFKDLQAYAYSKGMDINSTEATRSAPMIALQTKALIARDMWNTSAYFQIINQKNNAFNKAVEVINQDDFKSMNILE